MKNLHLGKVNVTLEDYASQGNAILGIRDSGKSYTATAIAEQLMEARIPIIAFDPIGIWRYLRVPGLQKLGNHGKGYEVVVAGGKGADLPLTARGAQEIVRAAMRENVSLVIDLYDIHMSKADWRQIVASCVRTLLYENGDHGLRHIFIEEAAEFAPQNVGPEAGVVYAEMEKLARMGGNALLGYTLINQRAEQVNKAVLELCDCLILHRQKGRNSINALSKWLDVASVAGGSEIIKSLPALAQGECWVWPAGSDSPTRTKIPNKMSFHPDRRARQAPTKSAREVDVSGFVATMRESLATITKEAEENDPKALRAKVASLTAQVSLLQHDAAKPRELAVDVGALQLERRKGFSEGYSRCLEDARPIILRVSESASSVISHLETTAKATRNDVDAEASAYRKGSIPKAVSKAPPREAPASRLSSPARQPEKRPTASQSGSIQTISNPAQRKFLIALAQQGHALARNQVAIFAGYKSTSGHVNNTLSSLRTQGYIEGSRDSLTITAAGLAALGEYQPLPTGGALRDYWYSELDPASRTMLRVLCDAYPGTLTRDEVADKSGYRASSGHINNTLSKLRTRELITGTREALCASSNLFD